MDENNNIIYWEDYRNGENPQTYGSIGGETEMFEMVHLLSEYPYQEFPYLAKAIDPVYFLGFANQSGNIYYQRFLISEVNGI